MGQVENGVVSNTFTTVNNTNEVNDTGQGDEVAILNEVDEGESKERKKRVPSVKVRLFKKLRSNSNSRASKLEFDADDFDVPVQKVLNHCFSTFPITLSKTSDDPAKASRVQPTDQPLRLGHPRHPAWRRKRRD